MKITAVYLKKEALNTVNEIGIWKRYLLGGNSCLLLSKRFLKAYLIKIIVK